MIRSELVFQLIAVPYELLTRHPVWERHCAQMATELPPGARRVLDLGCGPGNSTTHLREALGPGVIGADYSRAMLSRAHRRDRRLPLLCADASALPVREGSLDAVTFHSVLYLLPDRTAALAEVARALRPGGRAVLLEPQRGAWANLLGLGRALPTPHWALAAACWKGMAGVYGGFHRGELGAALARAGLRVVKLEDALGGLGLLAVAER